ncbi:MAG: hypothetical protein OET18_16925 [Desulfobacterales bacterium]|nr:hypothetical protein [Desulfobacterales bacterium]
MIYGIQFNLDAVKSMSLSRFKELYKMRFGENTESVYYEITGKVKKEKPKKKKKEEAPN